MSLIVPDFTESVIVRHPAAEVIGQQPITVRLLADSSSTGGALSTQRVTLGNGADGAKPHHHAKSAELFYLLDGTAQLLSGDQVVTAEHGDLVIVPPGLPHAFAAAPGHDADILIVITPGVERFEYFRHLERIAYGKVPPESLLEVQELYDTYFRTSPTWDAARRGPRALFEAVGFQLRHAPKTAGSTGEREGAVGKGVYQAVGYQGVQGTGSLSGVWPYRVEVEERYGGCRVTYYCQQSATALTVGAVVALNGALRR